MMGLSDFSRDRFVFMAFVWELCVYRVLGVMTPRDF